MLIPTLSDLLEQDSELLALPHAVHALIADIDDPDAGVDELGRLVCRDIVLTVKLLRLVNSPYYGLSAKIDSVKQAVGIVGVRALRDLVIATKVAERFNGLPEKLVSMRTFWDNALFGATLAKSLGRRLGMAHESIFAPALLRDIGALVMLWKMPGETAEVLARARQERREIDEVEDDHFGYTHAEVGARLMASWGLPASFAAVARYHHEFYKAPHHRAEVALVHLANGVAQHYRPWVNYRGLVSLPDLAAYELIAVSDGLMEQLAGEVAGHPHAGAMFN